MRFKEWKSQRVESMPWWAGGAYGLLAFLFGFNLIYVIKIASAAVDGLFFSSGVFPAWLQAFGSIAAIGVAIWLARSDQRHRTHARIDAELRYMGMAALIAEKSVTAVESVLDGMPGFVRSLNNKQPSEVDHLVRLQQEADARILGTVIAELQAVDPMKLAAPEAARSFISLKHWIILTQDIARHKVAEVSAAKFDDLTGWLNIIQSERAKFQGVADAFMSKDATLP